MNSIYKKEKIGHYFKRRDREETLMMAMLTESEKNPGLHDLLEQAKTFYFLSTTKK